ncbi:glutamate racemase [Salimicrobium jeotgali]|uniref:Glutamate racemase n=2 Tax=Salimicrobium jeotgali TaxID=1230341 RepID=A0AAC8PR10_9BACI|nr:glutamate racemase [Salimicrobium jeotgali]AKG04184.1 glutamate racemase [Salimicrobium jeotgali]MBM7695760.1 glutamate racemase [Salimicrobium jeotgali]
MDRPIGVIDSGVGGMTVVKELMRQLPKESIYYIGDTKRCPYGPRPAEEVRTFTWEMVEHLKRYEIKMLVVACNTATAFTLEELREKLTIPVLGVIEPGARAAISTSENKRIGVIGTEGTIGSESYPQALKAIDASIRVNSQACPALVPLVERGVLAGYEAHAIVRTELQPLKNKNGIDTLILGCTHYPLIKGVIQQEIGGAVKVISSGEETAREASLILSYNDLLVQSEQEPSYRFYTTGDFDNFKMIATEWFEGPLDTFEVIELDPVSIY